MICNDTINVAKEYNIKRHYDTNHKELYSCFEVKLREEKLKTLKNSIEKRQQVLTTFINIRSLSMKRYFFII